VTPASVTWAPVAEPSAAAWRPTQRELWRVPIEAPTERVLLDVGSSWTGPGNALLGGWSIPSAAPSRDRVWSIGDQSILQFDLETVTPLRLDLECIPFSFPGAPPQILTVVANGHALPELALNEGFHDYSIVLPATALRRGPNFVELGYSRVGVPAEELPASRDRRRLAVGFRRIALIREPTARNVEIALDDGRPIPGWLQLADGSSSVLLTPPGGAQLDLGWLRRGPAAATPAVARVEIETDESVETLWEQQVTLQPNPGRIRISLPQLAGKAVRLRFSVEQLPPGSEWFWLEPRLLGPDLPREDAVIAPAANVVLVVLDAAARSRLGLYGAPEGSTPELDSIANESLIFDDAHSQAAYTLASTASLFTSLEPVVHGVVNNEHKLNPNLATLASTLRDAGYTTAAFSANGYASPVFGMDIGFDSFVTPGGKGSEKVADAEMLGSHFESWLSELSLDATLSSRPFFAYVHFIQPHEPYHRAPASYYSGVDRDYRGEVDGSAPSMLKIRRGEITPTSEELAHLRGLYEGNLRYVDASVGQLRARLEADGLLERTILVIVSDHGEALGELGFFGHNYSMQEEVTAIPLLMRFPRSANLSGRRRAPAASIDIGPTLLAAVGVASPAAFEGRNLLGTPVDAAPPPRLVFSRSAHTLPSTAVWFEDFKYVDAPSRGGRTLRKRPDWDTGRSLVALHPVTFALLDRARRAFESSRDASDGPDAADVPRETREALEALGYILE
jgi:arylsulfatase A-like enzyme